MAWRWVNRAASLLLALVVLATLGGGYLFYRAMPATSGVETLPGLSAEVRVWRDHFGVPHIFAARWTTQRGRSATCTRASGCTRWRSRAASVKDASRKSGAPNFLASISSFAHSASIARPRRATTRFAKGAGAARSLC